MQGPDRREKHREHAGTDAAEEPAHGDRDERERKAHVGGDEAEHRRHGDAGGDDRGGGGEGRRRTAPRDRLSQPPRCGLLRHRRLAWQRHGPQSTNGG